MWFFLGVLTTVVVEIVVVLVCAIVVAGKSDNRGKWT